MKNKYLSLIVILSLCLTAFYSKAQLTFPSQTNGTSVIGTIGSLMPAYDPTATNSFNAKEVFVAITPLWKTQTASGSTPFLSTSAGYFFTKNIGMEGELVSLGNGAGSSTLDSMALLAVARKASGNLALYGLAGPSYDNNRRKLCADVGGGVEYRTSKGFGSFVDTRYSYGGSSPADNGFKTRVGLRFKF